MRILHVVPSFGLGGMEKIICAVINASTTEHQHAILSLDGCTSALAWISDARVRITPFRKDKSRRLFFCSLLTTLRQSQPDLLMTYNWGATDAIWLGRLAGISNIVHHEHGFNVDEGVSTSWRRDLIRFIVYRFASKIVVVSHELEHILRNRFGLMERRVTRIPNGIDSDFYSPDEVERKRIRKSLGFRDSDIVVGFSGRLDPVKNLDLLLDIFHNSNPGEYPFRLLVVGEGPDRPRLEARCRAEGLHAYVRLAGQHEQVLPYLRGMDVFLLTSLREQMPLTVLEAMGVGTPVIATRVGEVPYIIEDGTEGFIRDLDAPAEAFAKALNSLLCASKRKAMGAAARKRILAEFGQKTMLKHYVDLIQQFA
jgi:glycosyltransferase involved in cell wall biosynthesis